MTSAPEAPDPAPRRLRRGFSSLGCGELSLPAISALATRHGISDLELRVIDGRLDLPACFDEFGVAFARSLLDAAGQRVVVLGTSVHLFEGRKGLDELRSFAALAERLNCPWLRIFDGGPRNQPPRDEATWEPALELLSAWSTERQASGWNCKLLVETHDALVTSGSVVELAKRAPDGIHLLWDSHHTWHIGGEDIRETWQTLRPLIRHIHVKDSATAADGSRPYVLPGIGDFPLAELDAMLRNDGYDGVVSLEWERQWHPALAPLDEALVSWLGRAVH